MSVLQFGCFLVRSEYEGSLTLREMSDLPSYQADLGAVCVCSMTTGHGLLIHKASPRPCYVCSASHKRMPPHSPILLPFFFTHTWTPVLLTSYTSCTYVHTSHPSIVTYTRTRTSCLVALPAALTRLAALAVSLQRQMSVWEAFPPSLGLTFKAAAKWYTEPHANGVGELHRNPERVYM